MKPIRFGPRAVPHFLSSSAIVILVICAMLLWPKQTVAQAAAQQGPATQSNASGAKGAVPAVQTYPDSPQGLEELMKDMLKLDPVSVDTTITVVFTLGG